MRLAVVDQHDRVLLAWDTTTVAKQTFAALLKVDALTVKAGRWPRRKVVVDEGMVEAAVVRALDGLLAETIRL